MAKARFQIAALRRKAHIGVRSRISAISGRVVVALVALATQPSIASADGSTARWHRYGPADAPVTALWSDARGGATAAWARLDSGYSEYLRSNDGGRTWEPVHRFNDGAEAGRLAFSATPGIELVTNYPDINSDGATMFSSNDAGRSWAPARFATPPPIPLRDLQTFNPDNPREQVFQAKGQDAIAITHDGGAHWRILPIDFNSSSGPANTMVDWAHRILLTGAGEAMFEMQGLDAPESWQAVAEGSSTAGVRGGTILQLRNGGIYRSTDGALTFELAFPHSNAYYFIQQFAFAALPASRVYALGVNSEYGDALVYRSDDDGVTWVPTGSLYCECQIFRLEVDPFDPDRLLLSTADGVFESTDAGDAFSPLTAASGLPGAYAFRLVFESPDYSLRWVLGLRPAAATAGIGTWSHGAAGLGVAGESIQVIDSGTVPGVLFGVGNTSSEQRLYRSTDGSASWTLQSAYSNYGRHAYPFFGAAPDGTSLYLVGNRTSSLGFPTPLVLLSHDAGITWESAKGYPLGRVADIGASSTGAFRLYAATTSGLFVSDDRAATWIAVSGAAGRASAVGIDPRDARHLLVGYEDAGRVPLLRSDDGGLTWSPSAAGLGGGPISGIVFDPREAGIVYAAQSGQGVFRSTDGGETWRAIDAGLHAPQISRLQLGPDGSTLYASTDRGVLELKLDDGIPSGPPRAVEYFHAEMNHYFVSADPDEIQGLDTGAFPGWSRTGEALSVFDSTSEDALPVCRYFALGFAPQSTHFYSPYPHECGILASQPDWTFEKWAFGWKLPRAGGGCSENTAPIYRLFNNMKGGAPNHRYTSSMTTFEQMLFDGWIFEGSAETRVFACVPSE